jgi:hypothetical protein
MQKLTFVIAIACLCAVSTFAESGGASWGAAAAKKDESPTIESMLRYAIEDEYLAHAEYEAIMNKFGSQRPFSNIIQAEETHIALLRDEYAARNLPVPADNGSEYVVVPATLKEAFAAGVNAEIENIAMYDRFLADSILSRTENAGVRNIFVRLRDASKSHLSAFQKALSRYRE